MYLPSAEEGSTINRLKARRLRVIMYWQSSAYTACLRIPLQSTYAENDANNWWWFSFRTRHLSSVF